MVVDVSDDDVDADESRLLESDLDVEPPFSELVLELLLEEPESLLTDVIEEDSEPRLSVL